MRFSNPLGVLSLALATVLVASPSVAKDASPAPAAPAADQMQPPQPAVQHKQMAREVGVWNADVTMWQAPGGPAETAKGTETNTMLGSMWLVSEFTMEMGGQPYTGHGHTGYDPVDKQYVGTWIDSFSPYMMTMQGDYDVASHTLSMESEGRCCMSNQKIYGRIVTKYIDDDTKTMEMYTTPAGGEEFLAMKIEYKRAQ